MAEPGEQDSVWATGWVGRERRSARKSTRAGLMVAVAVACPLLAVVGELSSPATATEFGVVEGRVVDTRGQPVAGVQVRLQDADPSGSDDAMASGRTDARGHYRIQYAARAWDCCRGMRESDPDIYAEVWREREGTVARWELLRRSEVFPDHHPASPQTIHFVVGN